METLRYSPKKPEKLPVQPSQKEGVKNNFDSTAALKKENTILGKLRGRAREVAKVLILTSALIAGEGVVSTARAEEKQPTPVVQTEKEKSTNPDISEFIALNQEQQNQYLQTLAKEPPKYTNVKELWDGREFSSKKLTAESGMKRIAQLKEQLDELYEKETDQKSKEEINRAFLTVHRFTLEYGIYLSGRQELLVYNINNDETMRVSISGLVWSDIEKKPTYDPNETNDFLEDKKQGARLMAFIQEVKKISGSDLSKIKQIYDLVAYKIPRYRWYHGEGERGKHGYQTFEQLLTKQAGICTEKNALLVYALRQAGFDAYLWEFSGHIYTRLFTVDGVLEIDVTNSEPFNLSKLATQGGYFFNTDEASIKKMPKKLQQYTEKRGEEGGYHVSIPLDSEEAIEYTAASYGVSVEKIKEILKKIADVTPHPLYEIGKKDNGSLTPENSGKYSQDLFRERIVYDE